MLGHLTRYLDLGLAAKRHEVIFFGTTILFSTVYLMIMVSIITDELAMYTISFVNPNNNLRSLNRSLSATQYFFVAILNKC